MERSVEGTSRRRSGRQWRAATGAAIIERETPTEAAIGISFDGRPHTVLMATPADIADLAAGFTVTEGVADFAAILGIEVRAAAEGWLADVRLAPDGRRRAARPRTLEGRSSCGLCGVQRLADAVRPLPRVETDLSVTARAVQRATATLEDRQPLGRATRATHAAAFAAPNGDLLRVREDVGRHNALDKLAGALLADGFDPSAGFVVVTSRCSFEMVEKTARIGCPMIVAVSAPTDLAIRKAEEAGVSLVALARVDGHTVFSRADRLICDPVPA
ncbi:formate dehydrogenase accessory sulfurtransferase FdhD [Phenylobacterium sp.]|uniref:formate dehydrogenase accessory sulfurtransferase FdhD n=1 Tax=Phenylobacterium sp. TaxID=1871053 RepID=UPI002735EE15|nr:formate dehydrogenase accessory sulfurtransferase FdhD [Phenylobacterium sp.]MDP3855487.1 formate dehydrogenase accessory sulfurtransferase FdhD [Phenylobacterium sp.]